VLLMLPSGRYRQCQYTHTQSTNVLSVFRSGAKLFYLRKKNFNFFIKYFFRLFFGNKNFSFFFLGGGLSSPSVPPPSESRHTQTHTLERMRKCLSARVCVSLCVLDEFQWIRFDLNCWSSSSFFYDGLKINKKTNVSVSFFCFFLLL
jgi:hypothetical protein